MPETKAMSAEQLVTRLLDAYWLTPDDRTTVLKLVRERDAALLAPYEELVALTDSFSKVLTGMGLTPEEYERVATDPRARDDDPRRSLIKHVALIMRAVLALKEARKEEG